MANKIEQIVAEKILAMLETSNGDWRKPWKVSPKAFEGTEYEFGNKGFKRGFYHGVNKVTTEIYRMVFGWNSRVFVTQNDIDKINGYEWKDVEVKTKKGTEEKKRKMKVNDTGVFLKKKEGAHKVPIILWIPDTRKEIDSEEAESIEDDGKMHFITRYYEVYNTDEIEVVEGSFDFSKYQPAEPKFDSDSMSQNDIEKDILSRYKDAPAIIHGGNSAFYREMGNVVCVPTEDNHYSKEEYISTLTHELTHSTGIKDKLNRYCYEHYHEDKKYRAKEEFVAECGACLFCGHYGLLDVTVKNSANYLVNWNKEVKENPAILIEAISMALKSYEYIMGF